MLATLGEIKNSSIARIAGVAPSSQDFIDVVNEASEMLLNRGDWLGTVVPIRVCATKGCATFPRYVGKVRKINVCNSPMETHNIFWSFLPKDAYNCSTGCAASWLGGSCSMIDQSRVPTYQDIWGEGRYIRVYITDMRDVNKTITFFGVDNNGQPWSEKLTLANPYVQTQSFVRRVGRVLKDQTVGRLICNGYYAATGSIEELATYEPSETNPSLLRVRLNIPSCSGSCSSSSTDCPTAQPLAALVKLRFVPAQVDSDLVLIESKIALKNMIQSIRCGEQGDTSGKATFEAAAIRELNLGLWNEGDDQMTVRNDPFNGVLVSQQCL